MTQWGATRASLLVGFAVLIAGGDERVAAAGTGGNQSLPSTTHVLVAPIVSSEVHAIARDVKATVVERVRGTDFYKLKVGSATTADATVALLALDPRASKATLDEALDLPEGEGSTIPVFGDDPISAVASQAALSQVGAQPAQARASGAGVLVAVIDTGVDASHPLLAGHVAAGGWDFADGDDDPSDSGNGVDDNLDGAVDEGVGHGTFVASLVLAVAPDAQILPVRALNSDAMGFASNVAAAIGYAADHGARVINLSLGSAGSIPVVEAAVRYARDAGAVLVGAAGNAGTPQVNFPSAHPEVLAVAAIDGEDVRAPFSQYGEATDLCAPGESLIGAFPGAPSGTARWSGTSFATALVSGGVALVRERSPGWTPALVEDRIRTTGVSVAAVNVGSEIGERLDLSAATP